jgi:beta-lactamase regulating signal transducer with metallopeptidase domain
MMQLFLANMMLATLTLLLVLAVRRPVAQLFGAGWAYALWLLPVLRLAAQPLPSFAPEFLPSLTTVITLAGAPTGPVPSAGSGQWMPLLLALWAAGAAAFLTWQWLSYRRFLTRLSLTSTSIGAHRGLPLIESGAVEGPLALGLLDRRIVVPAEFGSRYSEAERRLALEHECVHHRRGDIWWNLLAILFLAANWFNPLAWIAFRAFRTDQELACDAAVVTAAASPEERCDYARALVKSASRPGLIAACPLNSADQLKRRLKMMKSHRKSGLRSLGGLAALGGAIVLTAAFNAPSFAQERSGAGKPETERFVIMDMRDGQAPPSGLTREFSIRRGDNGQIIGPEGCSDGDQRAVDADQVRRDGRTIVVMCGRGREMSAERRLQMLEQARTRIAERLDERGEDHRSRVVEALDREIARLRSR